MPRNHIKKGHTEVPPDGRRERHLTDSPQRDHARAFFRWLYDNLAEPLADSDELRELLVLFLQGVTRNPPVRKHNGNLKYFLPNPRWCKQLPRFCFDEERPGQDDYLDWVTRKSNAEESQPGSLQDDCATPVAAACLGIATTEVRQC